MFVSFTDMNHKMLESKTQKMKGTENVSNPYTIIPFLLYKSYVSRNLLHLTVIYIKNKVVRIQFLTVTAPFPLLFSCQILKALYKIKLFSDCVRMYIGRQVNMLFI